jgi:DnaJ-class molecular chaperone
MNTVIRIVICASALFAQSHSSFEDYAILGLQVGADMDAVKSAYRREALKWHPDTNADPRSNEIFISVSNAYSRIKQKLLEEEGTEIRQRDAFDVYREFMKGSSFSFSFSSGSGTITGTSRSSSTVIRNGMKTTTTEKKDFATGRVETTVFEENLKTGETVTRVSSNSVEL